MAALKTRIVPTVQDLDLMLRGGIKAGSQLKPPIVLGLHGLKLVFTAPAGTVTFADATGAGLSFKDILSQMTTAIATLRPRFVDGRLFIETATPSAVILNTQEAQSTAARVFGFATTSGASTLAGTLYAAPDGSAPRLVNISPASQMDSIIVVTEE